MPPAEAELRMRSPDRIGLAAAVAASASIVRLIVEAPSNNVLIVLVPCLSVSGLALVVWPAPIHWFLGRSDARPQLRRRLASCVFVLGGLYAIGAVPRTAAFARLAVRHHLLDGLPADTASALLPGCRDVRVAWYDLGPSLDADHLLVPPHYNCNLFEPDNWRDTGLLDPDRCALIVKFDPTGHVMHAVVIQHPAIAQSLAFDATVWGTGSIDAQLAMAHDLADTGSLLGIARPALYQLLGSPSGQCRFLSPNARRLDYSTHGILRVTDTAIVDHGA